MDTAAIQTIVSHMRGRSLYSILKAMMDNHFVELKAARWNLEVDGEPLGRAVMNHELFVDDVLGVAFESWSWTQKGQAHVLHMSGDRDGGLAVGLDGSEVKEPVLELETKLTEVKEQTILIVQLDFEGRKFVFEGLLE